MAQQSLVKRRIAINLASWPWHNVIVFEVPNQIPSQIVVVGHKSSGSADYRQYQDVRIIRFADLPPFELSNLLLN